MKRLLFMFAFVACAAIAMADAVVAFGTNTDGRAFTAQTILAGVNSWESDVLPDGNRVAITQEPAGVGKFWNAQAVAGTWTNETALAALNEFSGITFTAADMSGGTALKVAANSNAAVNAILNLILDAQNEGDLVTLYTTVSGWNCPLDEITVTGLDNCVIKYAPGDGGGFYETPVFTQVNQGLNLIVITGNLTADKHVTVTSPTLMNSESGEKTKIGFQIAAYKVTAGETPVNIESLAVVGTFPGMTWDPTEGVAMTQDSENPAIWTVTMNDVTVEGIKYEYKVTANGKWGDYEIPEQGNQDFVFGTDAYPAGTYNITFTADTENHTLAIEPVLVPQEEDAVYTITGCTTDHPRYGTEEAGFFGTAWDATIAANNMEKGADGLYTKTFENVYVNPPFYIKYQVVKNQTEAIGEKATFTAQTGGMYNVVFTFNPEDNSVTCELQSNVEPTPVYTLVGSVKESKYSGEQEASFFGEKWSLEYSANDMEEGADGIYTKSFSNIHLLAQNYIEYKVVKNHAYSNGQWGFGSNNANYIVSEDGDYNLTFKFNPDEEFENGYNVDVVVEKVTPQPQLNTYEVYVKNVPADFGRPYAYTWSVVDGATVAADAWPGKRTGMWQFGDGEMGYIYQIEAAEAPQFIIFNNGNSGEGNQTADLEFVNKQTYDLTELLNPVVVDDVYTITGCVTDHPRYGTEEAGFFGTAWDATIAANNMEKGADGLYTKTFENVYVNPPFYIKYQVVKNQTEAIGEKATFTAQTGGMYNVVFTFNPEDNSVTCELQSNVEPTPVYTLVGSVKESKYSGEQEASFFGEKWSLEYSANDMEEGADGIYTKSFSNIHLLAQNYIEYKVVKNHSYDEGQWGFGSNNANYIVSEDGDYNLTFKFNPDEAFEIGYNVDVVVEKVTPQPQLNTYEVYVKNVPADFGRPYAYTWSVVDGATVAADAWPGKRTGMWQFGDGEMGYIYQIEAAEAPQFIIFNNGQSGDGNQTADLEFVNKQTYDLTELMTPPVVEDAVYTITGAVTDHPRYGTEEAGFFGAMWDATVSANDMVKGEDGKYTKTFENVYVNPPYYILYQVVKNQTEAIGEKATFTAETGGMYNVVFTFNPEDNSVTCELQSNVEPEPVYTLVGAINTTEGGQEDVLFGTTWEPTLEANDMEKGADGIYTKSFENVALSYGDQILYKVVKNHAWIETWGFGEENADYLIQDDGEYNITFKFNPDAAFDNGFNVDVVVEKVTPQPQLNTYEVYVANVPEGFGRPYAYVWSMVDGEAVPVKDWPGTSMGMWQFGNGDMGFIFQVQAAEAPQFIIFNNGQSGEGNQTADLEFVNKQTYDLTELLQTSAETGATVITFGNNNPNRDYVTDPFVVSGVTNFEADLKDGTHLLLNHNSEGNPGGKFWTGNIAGEWTNSAAVNAVNEALGTAFVDADFAAGTNLATCDPGPGDAHSFLTLTFANAEKNTLELYASVTGRNGALDNITVTGLTNVIISYAVGSGDGFVEQPTFSPDALGITLVKIQGYLGDDKQVTVSSTSMAGEASAKNGFQMAAYTITDEVLPVVNVYTLAGNAPFFGTEWDVDNADNDMVKGADGVYTKTYENVSFDDQYTIEYKVVKNHSWDENWGFTYMGENADYLIEGAGTYNLTFKFVPEGTLAENDLSVTCIVESVCATGINAVNTEKNDDAVYNLQGIRVMNARKGIYIINGKKYVK